MEEDELKKRFDDFATNFEGKMFELISGFANIQDSFSRVQEGLDFLGKIRIQTAENKQILTKVEQSYKNLERKLREMSIGGFMIPERQAPDPSSLEPDEDFGALLSSTVSGGSISKASDDLKEFGDAAELPSLDDIIGKKQEPKKEPEPVKVPEPIPEPEPEKAPEPIPEPEPVKAPEPMPILEPEKAPEPMPILEPEKAPEPMPILEPEPETTPVPKQTPAPVPPEVGISPLPTRPLKPESNVELSPTPVAPKPIIEPEMGLSPLPTLKTPSELSPLPNKPTIQAPAPEAILTTNPVPSNTGIPPAPKQTLEPLATKATPAASDDLASQRVVDLIGPQDVWHNLSIDIQLSESNEQIALSLALANDNLKKFIKFHKVLFEVLKLASIFRKKGSSPAHINDKKELQSKIDSWKFELK